MIRSTSITMAVENTAGARGLLGEHGLAYFIEADDQRLLFDTGQGHVLAHNAQRLGLPLDRVQAIALSHGHYDHAGGLQQALDLTGSVDLYLHPDAMQPKYNRDGKPIGTPGLDPEILRKRARRLVISREPVTIAPGIHLTGEIPRRHAIEDTGGPFFQDEARAEADLLPDDQALYLTTRAGTLVLLGCGHSGVINTLEAVRDLTGGRPIHAVIGGMHLLRASEERLAFTAEALERLEIGYLAPMHCTGLEATCYLRSRLPDRFHPSVAGTRHSFVIA